MCGAIIGNGGYKFPIVEKWEILGDTNYGTGNTNRRIFLCRFSITGLGFGDRELLR